MSAVGFAVAGGGSRRMGRDKALLAWGGSDLLGHTLARLRAVGADVRILCGKEPRYAERGVAVVTDRLSEPGPLAGVLAGLEAAGGRPGIFLAVDLPFVPVALLEALAALAPAFDAVVPLSARGPEPLCAVYGPACLEPARRHAEAGDFRMTGFWPEVRVRTLGPPELAAFGDVDRLFTNVNEPVDYARLKPPDTRRAGSAGASD